MLIINLTNVNLNDVSPFHLAESNTKHVYVFYIGRLFFITQCVTKSSISMSIHFELIIIPDQLGFRLGKVLPQASFHFILSTAS